MLEKFIKDNELTFNEGSGGDNNILALCGYAVFKGVSLEDTIKAANSGFSTVDVEIDRVYNYAEANNYGKWWRSTDAKAQYKF